MPSWWVETILQPGPVALTLTTGAPTVGGSKIVRPDPVELSLVGGTPVVGGSTVTQPDPVELVLTGGTPDVKVGANVRVRPDGAELTLAAGTPAVVKTDNIFIKPAAAQLTLTGGTPRVIYAPPAFDAIGTGSSGTSATQSWTHTATAGAYVLVAIQTRDATPSVSSITYDGNVMTLLGAVDSGGDTVRPLYLYGRANVAGGAKTVAVTMAGTQDSVSCQSVSYTGVNSVSAATTTSGTGTSQSQAVTVGAGQRAVQVFGFVNSTTGTGTVSPSGGTNRYAGSAVNTTKLSISDATASTTFTATSNNTTDWGGIYITLTG